MTTDEHAKRRNEEQHELFAIRRGEAVMAAKEHELEEALEAFDAEVTKAEQTIDADLREEHWGHEPERLPFWRRGAQGTRAVPRPANPDPRGALATRSARALERVGPDPRDPSRSAPPAGCAAG
jgi:hypothetical protein